MDLGGIHTLDKLSKKVNDVSFQSDKTGSFKAPRQMSTHEIEDFLKQQSMNKSSLQQDNLHTSTYSQSLSSNSYSLPKLPPTDLLKESGTSKAVANAMRALQDKVRYYETENDRLTQAVSTLEEKCLADRERWQQRFMEEMNSSNEKEKAITSKIFEVEEELRRHISRTVMLEEQNRILEDQAKFSEREIKRNLDQYNIDKDNLILQLEHTQKLLQASQVELDKLLARNHTLEHEQKAILKELNSARTASSTIHKELEVTKQTVETQKIKLQKVFTT